MYFMWSDLKEDSCCNLDCNHYRSIGIAKLSMALIIQGITRETKHHYLRNSLDIYSIKSTYNCSHSNSKTNYIAS